MKKFLKMLMLIAVIGVAADRVQAQLAISVRIGPPPLPVYVQPPCPVDGYLWQPGYWAWDPDYGYYWVPGEWVAPPYPGVFWTPCWWGWDNGVYLFHAGYWGPHVGFYGGINYGFGYPGTGFYGGVWSGRTFRYNTAVFNVNRTVIHNTYVSRAGIPSGGGSRISYNGGRGGINRQPTSTERHFASEHHIAPTHAQMEHQQAAVHNPAQRFNTNHGRPANVVNRGPESHGAPARGGEIGRGAASHQAPNMGGHEARMNNAPRGGGGRPQMENRPRGMQPNMGRANFERNNGAPRMQQQHASQPEQRMNHMPSQPMGGGERHMGGGPPGGGGMPHGGGGMPHGGGGPPGGGGGGGHGHHG